MRLRQFLAGAAVICLTLTITPALLSPDQVADVKPMSDNSGNANKIAARPMPPSSRAEDKVLASAYLDTLSILSTTNGCSAFFGGPKASVDIFTQLMSRIRHKLGKRQEPEVV